MPISPDLDEDDVTGHYQNLHLEDSEMDATTSINTGPSAFSPDRQGRNAYYDYASEKSLSHADAKLFYQSHQQQQSSEDALRASEEAGSDLTTQPMSGSVMAFSGLSRQPTRSFARTPTQPILDAYTMMGSVTKDKNSSPGPTSGTRNAPTDPGTAQPFDGAVIQGLPEGVLAQDNAMTAELAAIYASIREVLELRHKFIGLSLQREGDNPKDDSGWNIYPSPPEPVWDGDSNFMTPSESSVKLREARSRGSRSSSKPISDSLAHGLNGSTPSRNFRKPGQDIGADFDMDDLLPLPQASNLDFELDESGVFQVYSPPTKAAEKFRIIEIPTIRDYYVALDRILLISSDGPTKSFAFRRLQYLEGKYNLYFLQCEYQETADSKRVPHRDFYNVRKVDTHVHHSSCMNQKHLLRFIKSKMKKCPDEVVLERDGKLLTLTEVFESISLTAYDLSIDTLDMHVSLKLRSANPLC